MEVDNPTDPPHSATVQGCVTVKLHPLVVLNISEHWTRNKVKENSQNVVVYGALLGKQEGHHVEIMNSFELLLDEPYSSVNPEFYASRESQCKQVYPDLDIVGWYTTGGSITELDEAFNRQMQELNESLLIMKLDPIRSFGERLPIKIYESVIDNDGRIHFRQVMYTLETDEAERIGVNYVAKISMSGSSESSSVTAEQLLSNYQAVQMLYSRLRLIRVYVAAVSSGELPINRARLRDISALTKRLLRTSFSSPASTSSASRDGDKSASFSGMPVDLYHQANDVCLTSLLACLTQGLLSMHTCIQRTTRVVDRRSLLRGGLAGPFGAGPRMTVSGSGINLG